MTADRRGEPRRPAAAGTFYPASGAELEASVEALLRGTAAGPAPSVPRGLIVPHAGYVFSGPIAASAYALLAGARGAIARVVLLGPAHFVALDGAAVPEAPAWCTPLGLVAIDQDLARRSRTLGAVADDAPHAPDHALEVQLPFLQLLLGADIRVLPIAVGTSEPGPVAELLAELVEPGVLLVVSTDLSHYLDLATARRVDRRTAAAITAREPRAIGLGDACGVFALRGALEWARRRALPVRLLDLRTSADTAGDPSRVVGYGAFAIG